MSAAGIVAEVGRFYMVPCMQTTLRGGWLPRDGWVPIIGPRHRDGEHLGFPWEHYHVDWRFVPDAQLRHALHSVGFPHHHVLTNTHGGQCLEGSPVLKRRMCRRPMPEFPRVREVAKLPETLEKWRSLERAHSCARLKPGNVCPHRGIDLTPFAREDGTAVCPGHGLRWNLRTGELVPHHGVEA